VLAVQKVERDDVDPAFRQRKATMKPLIWSAPAPCPRINVTPARFPVAAG